MSALTQVPASRCAAGSPSGIAIAGQPAVLAVVEDVPGRDPLRRLGHLAAEPVVGQALVGVAAAGLVDHQPAAEAERERAAAVGLLEAGAEPAERPEVGRRAQRDRRPRSARRCWCRAAPSSRRCRRGRRARGASPRCPRSRPAPSSTPRRRADLDRSLGRHRGDAGHAAVVVGHQPGHRQVGADLAALADEDRGEPGDQRLPAAEGVAAALAGPVALDRRPHQLRDLGRQVAALDVGRLDRPAERHPAGRVVVLRERQPLEVEVRVGLELGDQLGRGARGTPRPWSGRRPRGSRRGSRARPRSSPGSRRAAGPGCPAASRRRRSTPRCRRSAASSRPRTPRARPWRPAPRRSAHRRPTRPPRRRTAAPHRAMVATRTCSRQAWRIGSTGVHERTRLHEPRLLGLGGLFAVAVTTSLLAVTPSPASARGARPAGGKDSEPPLQQLDQRRRRGRWHRERDLAEPAPRTRRTPRSTSRRLSKTCQGSRTWR